MTVYAMLGRHTRELLTYQGRPIIGDHAVLDWLLGRQGTVVQVSADDLKQRSPLPPITVTEWLDDQGIIWGTLPPGIRGGSNA